MNGPANRASVMLAFASASGATQALETFKQLEAAQVLRLKHAAIISRDAGGQLSIHETGDLSPQLKWVLVGAAATVGFVAGTLWRGIRVGLIAGYAAGQVGAFAMSVFDPGFSTMHLEHLAEDVPADNSLLVANAEFKSESMAAVIQSRFAGARIVRPAAPPSTPQPGALSAWP